MASKSKRRRRVLGASCILAALIVGASSFAWFTSKDEVTNRLSANADYGVRIVESFAPPENWIPGQEVNKDVYAVNTGNIAAFVEEKVSSVMTVTKETRVATKEDGCTELTKAERYSVEAGSYLALVKPDSTASAHQPGEKIVSFNTSNTDLNGYTANTVVTDFTPDVSGVYVFRRTVKVNNSDHSEQFEYDSYYYDATTGKYYKTVLTSITPDDKPDTAGDKEKTDGNLTDATVMYFKDVTTTSVPKLVYDAANKRLVATVDGTSYINDTALQSAGTAYDKALHDYEVALAERARALAEDGIADTALKNALDELNTAEKNEAAKEKAFKEALAAYDALKAQLDAANAELGTATDSSTVAGKNATYLKALYGDLYANTDAPAGYASFDGHETETFAGLYGAMKAAYNAKVAEPTSEAAFLADLQAWITDRNYTNEGDLGVASYTYNSSDSLDTLIAGMSYAKLQEFKTWIAATPASENHDAKLLEADYYIAKKAYDNKVAEYDANHAIMTNLNNRIGDSTTGLTKDVADAKNTLVGSNTQDLTVNLDNIVDALTKDSATITNGGLYGDWYNAAIETAKKQDLYNTANDNANAAGTGTSAHLDAANAAVAKAKAQLDLASNLYTQATTEYNANHDIVVYINLSNDVVTEGGTADKWQILPTTVGSDNTAYFYYTGILQGGETSAKLIDNVTLAPSVTQDMYKYFDFDLNVSMNSAQIVYADDNKTILTTPVDGDTSNGNAGQLGAKATLTDPTDINTAITWTARNP